MIHTIRYLALMAFLLGTASLWGQRDNVPARAKWGEQLTGRDPHYQGRCDQ